MIELLKVILKKQESLSAYGAKFFNCQACKIFPFFVQ